MPSKCKQEGCKRDASYNYRGQTKRLYCKMHKLPDMITVRASPDSRMCIHESHTTRVRPSFNFPGETRPIYCDTHKLPGMINVKNKKLVPSETTVIPDISTENNDTEEYDFPNVSDEIVLTMANYVEHIFNTKFKNNFITQILLDNPRYSAINTEKIITKTFDTVLSILRDKKDTYEPEVFKCTITLNKPPGKVVELSRKLLDYSSITKILPDAFCVDPSHKKSGIYAKATHGITKPTYCSKHKGDTPQRRNGDLCIRCSTVSPSYGIPETQIRTHCSKCADKSIMIDLLTTPCEEYGCMKCATYGYPGGTLCDKVRSRLEYT